MNYRSVIVIVLAIFAVGLGWYFYSVKNVEIPDEIVSVKLYYYNPALDQGPGGVQCTEKGLVAVERVIPKTITPIQDAIKLLLRGEITPAEKAKGVTSEYPLEGLVLTGASLKEGTLTLSLNDPQGKTIGGACRVTVLRLQVEATAKQFPGVSKVAFTSEGLFQP